MAAAWAGPVGDVVALAGMVVSLVKGVNHNKDVWKRNQEQHERYYRIDGGDDSLEGKHVWLVMSHEDYTYYLPAICNTDSYHVGELQNEENRYWTFDYRDLNNFDRNWKTRERKGWVESAAGLLDNDTIYLRDGFGNFSQIQRPPLFSVGDTVRVEMPHHNPKATILTTMAYPHNRARRQTVMALHDDPAWSDERYDDMVPRQEIANWDKYQVELNKKAVLFEELDLGYLSRLAHY